MIWCGMIRLGLHSNGQPDAHVEQPRLFAISLFAILQMLEIQRRRLDSQLRVQIDWLVCLVPEVCALMASERYHSLGAVRARQKVFQ